MAQDLAAQRLEIERLSQRESNPATKQQLDELAGRTQGMLETVRRTLLDLRLSVLESMGFVPAVRLLLERMEREQRIRTHLMLDGDEAMPLSYRISITMFRILQECLLNVTQHAKAAHVFVSVTLGPDEVVVTVEDDGCGFNVDRMNRRRGCENKGLGVLGMVERAHLVGGKVEITAAPGEGTTVVVRIPNAPDTASITLPRSPA